MRRASIRDLRYRFPEIEEALRQGQPIEIARRKRVVATLVPVTAPTKPRHPDFMGRLKAIYGNKQLAVSGAKLLGEERDRF